MKADTLEKSPPLHRFTCGEYDAMAEMGLFADERVELINGEIVQMSPQSELHSSRITRLTTLFGRVFFKGFLIRTQVPLHIAPRSEPEPDFAIVDDQPLADDTLRPTTARLVVEISNTRINYDREVKGSLYAKAAIPEYWLINLKDECVEVFRNPIKAKGRTFGWGYSTCQTLSRGEWISPLCVPTEKIAVKDLLPYVSVDS